MNSNKEPWHYHIFCLLGGIVLVSLVILFFHVMIQHDIARTAKKLGTTQQP